MKISHRINCMRVNFCTRQKTRFYDSVSEKWRNKENRLTKKGEEFHNSGTLPLNDCTKLIVMIFGKPTDKKRGRIPPSNGILPHNYEMENRLTKKGEQSQQCSRNSSP